MAEHPRVKHVPHWVHLSGLIASASPPRGVIAAQECFDIECIDFLHIRCTAAFREIGKINGGCGSALGCESCAGILLVPGHRGSPIIQDDQCHGGTVIHGIYQSRDSGV